MVGLWFWWAIGLPGLVFGDDPNLSSAAKGLWGDSFGALNALFSAFGFSAIVVTLYFQYRQIVHQQKQSEEQQKEILNAASYRNNEQFESSLFELLKLFRDVRDEVRFKYTDEYIEYYNEHREPHQKAIKKTTTRGLRAFRASWNEIYYNRDKFESESDQIYRDQLANIYDNKVHKRYESTFGPYFRLVYTILFRIKNEKNISEKDKITYGNLFRCQVSSFELTLIAVNGLSGVSKDLSDILEHFHFLWYAPVGSRRNILLRCYPPEAFAARPDDD